MISGKKLCTVVQEELAIQSCEDLQRDFMPSRLAGEVEFVPKASRTGGGLCVGLQRLARSDRRSRVFTFALPLKGLLLPLPLPGASSQPWPCVVGCVLGAASGSLFLEASEAKRRTQPAHAPMPRRRAIVCVSARAAQLSLGTCILASGTAMLRRSVQLCTAHCPQRWMPAAMAVAFSAALQELAFARIPAGVSATMCCSSCAAVPCVQADLSL